ncbi:MAG: outer membrane protein assembly factor BamB family protein [Limisphaerales bacterium]
MLIVLCFSAAVLVGASAVKGAESWPTLHGNLQRLGYYSHFPKGPLKVAWRKELHQELTGTRCEVIAGCGLAFMGTYAGNLYAWEIESGKERWVFQTGGAIGHSPMLNDGTVYFGSMDRRLYAVDAATGKEKWRSEAEEGIWTSPVVFNGLVMFGGRDGKFQALDAANGEPVWEFQTGDRILTSASISQDGDRVVFASEDMHVYCLDLRLGRLRWKSRRLHGLSIRDYFPVVFRGLAFLTTNPVKEFHGILDEHQNMVIRHAGFTGKDARYIPSTPEKMQKEQEMIIEHLKARPSEQTFYAFRMSDGTEPWIAPILYTGGLHNPMTPPCVNPQTGEVFVQVRSAYGVWDGGGEVRPYTGVGKLNLETGGVELIEHAHRSKEPGRPAGRKDMPWMTFNLIGDETQTLSCSSEYLFSNHQGLLGALDLKTGLTRNMHGKRDTYGGFYGPGNFGWENEGGYKKAEAAGEPFGIVNEWHGPAKAIVSVAGGRVFFPSGSQVICMEATNE